MRALKEGSNEALIRFEPPVANCSSVTITAKIQNGQIIEKTVKLDGTLNTGSPVAAESLAPPQGTYTYEFENATLEFVLKAISNDMGVKIGWPPALSGEKVSFTAKDVSLEQLLDRVAKAIGGAWSKEKDGSYKIVKGE